MTTRIRNVEINDSNEMLYLKLEKDDWKEQLIEGIRKVLVCDDYEYKYPSANNRTWKCLWFWDLENNKRYKVNNFMDFDYQKDKYIVIELKETNERIIDKEMIYLYKSVIYENWDLVLDAKKNKNNNLEIDWKS